MMQGDDTPNANQHVRVPAQWLALSGVRWPDPAYSRMPFHAALPMCPEYPCYSNMLPECRSRMDHGVRPHCMDGDLDNRIQEVLDGARLLLDPAFDLVAAARGYEALAHEKGVKLERLYTLDMLRTSGALT